MSNAKTETLGRNIQASIADNTLTLKISLTPEVLQAAPLSKSGNNSVFASTCGNVDVPGMPNVKLGVNCYGPAS